MYVDCMMCMQIIDEVHVENRQNVNVVQAK